MFSIFGFSGQHLHNYLDNRRYAKAVQRMETEQPTGNLIQRLSKHKWSPLKELADDEYENILKEKLLKIETEVALIDDRIGELRKEQANASSTAGKEKSAEKGT